MQPLPRFIPVRRRELLPRLLEERDDDEAFSRVAELVRHVLRHEADERAERLQRAYAPFDPDPLASSLYEEKADEEAFVEAFEHVLEKANFRTVPRDELEDAFGQRSLFPLHVTVDVDEYDILRLYRRGYREQDEKVRGWRTLWMWRTRHLQLFERLIVALRLKPEALEGDRHMRTVGMEPGRIYLKAFKNIPKADLEMVLPNTRLRMRPLDRVLVWGPLVAGIGWTLFESLGILLTVLEGGVALALDEPRLRALGGVVLVIAGYLWRTHTKIKTTRLDYMRTLSQGLYFRNLANNRAVLDQLLAFALDENEKEALIGYHFLTKDGPMPTEELDHRAGQWILDLTGRETDFDVQNGLAELRRLGLVEERDGVWRALEPKAAAEQLAARWNGAMSA